MSGSNILRRESLGSVSVFSESDGGSYVPSNAASTSNSRESSLTPPPSPPSQLQHQSLSPTTAPTTTIRIRNPNYHHPPAHATSTAPRISIPHRPGQSMIDVMDAYEASSNPQRNTISSQNDLPADTMIPQRLMKRSTRNHSPSSSSSSALIEEEKPLSERRYTAAEKGKGRAVVSPIEIESSEESGDNQVDNTAEAGDESIQIIHVAQKRRRKGSSDEEEILDAFDRELVASEQEEIDEEHTLAGGYTCPVCFCPPSQAVMTPCGHILCAQCLHSSLLAAIGRNPNPYPDQHPHRGGGRYGARGSAGGNANRGRSTRGRVSLHGIGPAKWTKELLQQYYQHHLDLECEKQLVKQNVDQQEWNTIKELQVPKLDDIKVEEKLKGLWRLEDSWVVEGECPICRNNLPGGYGPPGTNIGGIIPLQARLSTHTNSHKRKKVI
uniref:RING-type domain-containing protein n=1 Tax=Kwoniella dejecticola CBS 10117 TaxID=1296121 RepID=A0A1A6A8N4_9TREE|nr:uncharacterized protein I303_02426 [Kwoniella dejecticola CBS 10117]OBR86419.1 hypothetical protein I303_02426 [Kwoniella dejecticola CBS 10117]